MSSRRPEDFSDHDGLTPEAVAMKISLEKFFNKCVADVFPYLVIGLTLVRNQVKGCKPETDDERGVLGMITGTMRDIAKAGASLVGNVPIIGHGRQEQNTWAMREFNHQQLVPRAQALLAISHVLNEEHRPEESLRKDEDLGEVKEAAAPEKKKVKKKADEGKKLDSKKKKPTKRLNKSKGPKKNDKKK